MIPDRPALGAYRLTDDDRAARAEWVRWLIDEHTRAWHAQRRIEAELAGLMRLCGGVDPSAAAARLRALADQLAS